MRKIACEESCSFLGPFHIVLIVATFVLKKFYYHFKIVFYFNINLLKASLEIEMWTCNEKTYLLSC